MNGHLLTVLFLLVSLASVVLCRENEGVRRGGREDEDSSETPKEGSSWWSGFKTRVKGVLSRWRDDIRLLWDEVLSKADDMRGWTSEVFDSFKRKMNEWVESRKELPDDEKNEIETFISKLKVPTEDPPAKNIDP